MRPDGESERAVLLRHIGARGIRRDLDRHPLPAQRLLARRDQRRDLPQWMRADLVQTPSDSPENDRRRHCSMPPADPDSRPPNRRTRPDPVGTSLRWRDGGR